MADKHLELNGADCSNVTEFLYSSGSADCKLFHCSCPHICIKLHNQGQLGPGSDKRLRYLEPAVAVECFSSAY